MNNEHLWYFVALFDVLGFESKFEQLGLGEMAKLYDALISDVNAMNVHASELNRFLHIEDEATWTADGDAFIFNRVNGAYASDSIVLWAHAHFPQARSLSEAERESQGTDPGEGWKYHIIPCDRFLEACNNLLCHAFEIGLPLRGAISLGPSIIDEQRRVFLGRPMIDAARGEKAQKIVGASLTPSFIRQVVPARFTINFRQHLKHGTGAVLSDYALDWPRHWRRTRKHSLRAAVSSCNADPKVSDYYENTLKLIDASEQRCSEPDGFKDWSIRTTYPQFSSPDLKLNVRAVRRVAQPLLQGDVPGSVASPLRPGHA